MAEKLRPAPEQPDQIEGLINKADRISELLKKMPVYERFGMQDVVRKLQTADRLLDRIIRRELRKQAQEFVVFEAPKPTASETKSKRKRTKKSRGLNDPRPIEFSVPGTGKKLRGKEGKGVKLLYKSANRTLDKDQLASELYPGVKIKSARERVNRIMRSTRKHLVGSRFDVETRRDYEKKTTYYSLKERKTKARKKR